MEKIKAQWENLKLRLSAIKKPQLPNFTAHLPNMPTMPSMPQLPAISIPLPEPVKNVFNKFNQLDGMASSFGKLINYFIVILTVLGQFETCYEYLAFIPLNLIQFEYVPYFWTLVTSVFLDTNIIYLFIQIIMLNYLFHHLEQVWTLKHFLQMMVFISITSGLAHLSLRYLAYAVTSNQAYLEQGYTSINPMVLTVIMGLRQIYPERTLDTKIPFIKGNLFITYKILPQIYIGVSYLISFLLEIDWDLRLISVFYFSWFYLRFFMKTKINPQQMGDSSTAFGLYSFFPLQYQEKIQKVCDRIFEIANFAGAFDYILRKFNSPLQNTSDVERKRALDSLDEELESLKSKQAPQENQNASVVTSEQNYSTIKKRANLSFSDQGDEDFSEIEIKIKEELRKE